MQEKYVNSKFSNSNYTSIQLFKKANDFLERNFSSLGLKIEVGASAVFCITSTTNPYIFEENTTIFTNRGVEVAKNFTWVRHLVSL